jgi:tRNA U34 5-carboxymethylaminomethyl modifying enzyme MnmG/GidA
MPAEAKAPVAGDTVSKGVSVIDLKKSLASEPKRNVTIRAEMTLSEVADQAGVKAEDLAAKLGIPEEGAGTQRLSDLGALYGFDLEKVRKVVMEQAGDCIETCKVE